jgi:hypothetical protein
MQFEESFLCHAIEFPEIRERPHEEIRRTIESSGKEILLDRAQ